ncbi:DNA polymerase Y family protein [Pseudidiomarina sp.]|uniref:Y-family DNA polymerase n=1 Tax=Pseudidiomarina sp. TaxID=2081707 RepID=UPI00299D7629|nr:DNA polymerase Y family protein [Pseudidiomarina sp.]MDX1706819.1 DNA polymerase Y family protein [Pseudidiomarina sp.]
MSKPIKQAATNAWLYLHAPQLLIDYQSALQSAEQQQQPQALAQSAGAGKRYLVQANQAALDAGVSAGMAEVTASTLLPELQLRDYQGWREQQVLQQLAQVIYQDVAQIALYPPQGLLFEVRSLLKLYGGYAGLHQRLQQRLQDWPVRLVLASGYSPLSARLLAEAGQQSLCSDPQQVSAALQRLPITASGLPAAQIKRLQEVGLDSVGALLSRPAAELGARFGKAVTLYLAELRGDYLPPQHYFRPPVKFYQRLDLLSEVSSWPQLLFPLKRLLHQLEVFLQIRQLSLRGLTVQAYHRDQPPTKVRVNFAHAVWQQQDLLNLCQLQLENYQLIHPALELSVQAGALEPRTATAGALIGDEQHSGEPGSPTTARPLGELISRLQARLGAAAVQVPVPVTDWRPERAHQYHPWREQQATTRPASLPRPLWLLPEPQVTELRRWQLQWGPERISSGWWDDQAAQRDYFIALDEQQRQGWIYQSEYGWFLHGWFT